MSHSPTRRTVVTGAAGFVGSHLVEALLAAGHRVVGIDAFTSYYEPAVKRANIAAAMAHPRFQLLAADLVELDLAEILQPGDWVFHMAAQPGVRGSWGSGFPNYVRSNIEATQRLLEAARNASIARLIFASSSSVYGDVQTPMREAGPTRPISPYGVTKLTGEQLCLTYGRAFGLEVVPLRFFTVYGPRQRPDMAFHRFIEAVLDGTPLTVYGDGSQLRDYTYVADVVRILLAAATRGVPGSSVNVGGGSAVSVAEAIALIERFVGRPAIVKRVSAPPGDARDTLAATDRLRELADLPRVDIAAGLERQVAWHVERRAAGGRPHASLSRGRMRRGSQDGAVMLYSHDTYGLGHLRRNLAIAHAILERRPKTRVVMVTGLPVADEWRRQIGVELITMPTAVKVGAEDYLSVDGRSMSGLLAERAGIVASTLVRLRPRTFLVDHAPLGMKGELRLALQIAREQLPATRVVLGLRDILDDPATVVQVWRDQGAYQALDSFYDELLVYGSAALFDIRELYQLPASIRSRTAFTGYVAKSPEMETAPEDAWPAGIAGPRYLVTGGGGGDATELLTAFLAAWPSIRRRTGGSALLVAGPRMASSDRATHTAAVAGLPAVEMVESSERMLGLISRSDVVVSMGGYNTVVEALTARRALVLMPRVAPRREQLIRARIMETLGLARVVLAGSSARDDLVEASASAVAAGPPPAEALAHLDLGGRDRVAAAVLRPLTAAATS